MAVWCREIAIPAVVMAVLITASAPANNVYSLAIADVTPATSAITPDAANVPLSGELVSVEPLSVEPATTAALPMAAAAADTPRIETAKTDTIKTDTPKVDLAGVDAADVDAAGAATPNTDAAKGSGPVLAALEMPTQTLAKPSPDMAAQPNNLAGPQTDEVYDAANSIEIDDECLVIDVCADRYLWQLYQKTKKEDSIRESTSKKVTIKRKGKSITVTRTTSYVVDEDFGWKDPKAATNARMSLADYVIGGVDRNFKLRLFSMLHAADQAGLAPGITSGFRDDYRQSIASGLKAASNRSFHGGSLRGGYGHGLAADIVSTKGATRAERLTNSNALWKWVDDHGSEFGIGRPYLDRDPPHVAPNDGEEFARHRPGVKTRQATAAAN
ncbi:D-alanyl-D-alanine carboxypeptidase family protein [Bradyrhizobium erythrophlei]|jgi:hypothetical protein|uniref:D-alanyl-D-alanine carboxypeptidase n=1 Tax=Bradyrhizobium erythrophlei TaxID=1437360 RepID=A0A1M7UFD1_9BRAD|nr:D-alanyl-D-alanine carboxypeptidase family protein [Bradyrhizobium erythrophlei]SHN81698.1 D-alanyl-D-alanine carboxypeptidase [Bradyrhizobium erythrophlei]